MPSLARQLRRSQNPHDFRTKPTHQRNTSTLVLHVRRILTTSLQTRREKGSCGLAPSIRVPRIGSLSIVNGALDATHKSLVPLWLSASSCRSLERRSPSALSRQSSRALEDRLSSSEPRRSLESERSLRLSRPSSYDR